MSEPTSEPASVDEYLRGLPDDRREAMSLLRRTIRAAAPDATEVITYKMPGFKMNGTFLVSYDSFKRHYSLFPASQVVVEALGDEIRPYLAGRSTVRFPVDRPIPVDLVTRIIEVRLKETAAR